MNSNKVSFDRSIDKILATTDALGLLVVAGWTVTIPRAAAIEYVNNYNLKPTAGFYHHAGKVVLGHEGAKIALSGAEAEAIVALIKASFMGK